MSIEEFLKQLELQLHDLSPEERENAIAYYREYLEEAGENVQDAIDSLGSPQSVAERILSEMGENHTNHFDGELHETKSAEHSNGRIGLTVAVIVVTFPIWITVFCLWAGLICMLGGILGGLGFSAVIAPIQGIMECHENIGQGLWDIGCGVASLGLVLLCWKPLWWAGKSVTVWLVRLCKNYINGLMGKECFT